MCCTSICLCEGKLLRWTKDFDADGTVGEDVVKLMHQAFERRGVSEMCGHLHVYAVYRNVWA